MSRSLSGLTEGIFSEIDVLDTISIDGNAGTQGQVLTTDGTNCDWQDITIADGSITNSMLTTDCVGGSNILSGAIIESKLGAQAVTSAKIKDAAVGTTQIAGQAVTNAKIANGAINHLKIATGGVATTNIESEAVGTSEIATQAVTNPKIANGAVNHLKISAGGVATTNIEDDAVTTAKINDLAVTNAKLAGSINYNKLDASTAPAITSLSNLTAITLHSGFPTSANSTGTVFIDNSTGILKVHGYGPPPGPP